MHLKYDDIVRSVIGYSLILLFLYSAINKFMDMQSFYADLINSPLFKRDVLSRGVQWALPIYECSIAVLLMVKYTKKIALIMAIVTLLIFTIYLAVLLGSGMELPCSCGGIISMLNWKQHLIFN